MNGQIKRDDLLKKFRKNLLSYNPPSRVIKDFDEICNIATLCETEDTLEDLLKDACRRSNWTVPWEANGVSLSFRARKLPTSHAEYKEDIGGNNTPAEEQCYRRGFHHGFATARRAVSNIAEVKNTLNEIEGRIRRWRMSDLQSRNSMLLGEIIEPEYPCRVRTTSRRSGLSLRTRYAVLERDRRRCVICGVSVIDGVVLEVDHIVPVSKGGTDEMENLQTLCYDCNRGKADSISSSMP